MAPKKAAGIVKHGNAGNSSKLSIPDSSVQENKPLFPPGFKYPLSLLHERCVVRPCPVSVLFVWKRGFAPRFSVALSNVDTVRLVHFILLSAHAFKQRKQPAGWSFVVTLSTLNSKTSQKETVRLEPHPPYILPTALEARHWGATYALYCVRALTPIMIALHPFQAVYSAVL